MCSWESAHMAWTRVLAVAAVNGSTILQSKRVVATASFWWAWPHSAKVCLNVVVTPCTTVKMRDAAKTTWFPEVSSVNGCAANENATTLSKSNVATVKSSPNTCRAILSQRSVVGLAMIQRFRSVVLLGWCQYIFPVRLEFPVDMLSTILNINNVATVKSSSNTCRAVCSQSVVTALTVAEVNWSTIL